MIRKATKRQTSPRTKSKVTKPEVVSDAVFWKSGKVGNQCEWKVTKQQ